MSTSDDLAQVAKELELAAKLTKQKLAVLLIMAISVIRELMSDQIDFRLEAMKPKGRA